VTSLAVPDVALGYERVSGRGEERIWITLGGSHRVPALGDSRKKRLVSAILELRPEPETRLVLLGVDVDGLQPAGRAVLRDRIAFLPADGGLLSNLNGWENIVLPLGFHRPGRLRGIAAQVNDLIRDLGGEPEVLLDKLPERMSPYERKLTGYVRIALEKPDLLLAEDSLGGLDAAERAAVARFASDYLGRCPGATFVELEAASRP
jgi:ABC-type lipoprotein export system ATPase subunit